MKKTKELEDQMDVILVELSIGRLSIPLAAGKARKLLAQVDKKARIQELKKLNQETRTLDEAQTEQYLGSRLAALTEDKDNGNNRHTIFI